MQHLEKHLFLKTALVLTVKSIVHLRNLNLTRQRRLWSCNLLVLFAALLFVMILGRKPLKNINRVLVSLNIGVWQNSWSEWQALLLFIFKFLEMLLFLIQKLLLSFNETSSCLAYC